ncbi:hypothetical protein [Pseudonocardia hydrocarbonoxydans]|uniref:Uncharacterized protein n=1 Tax=Pseudonocardia hydrocarbonoxydans TaxID=76726 RepID=A0A4Y3WMC6_9PSEU|nr:hypothetical protein [Pseudonocardia hydrocarbonoxydans]GEC18506.1 hypothetical protein PHY01_07890 [Pseudonocardia hydrocarbonoxydans]
MTRPDDDEQRPSWMGAPGYSPPPPGLAPHAPMPGAPPYPPHEEHPPPPVGDRGRTGYLRVLGATAVWAVLDLVLLLVLAGRLLPAEAVGRAVGTLLVVTAVAALGVWLVLRSRARTFWVVLAVALPFFLVVRLLSAIGGVAS